MHGTGDVALNRLKHYRRHLASLGFTRGKASPCLCHHESGDIKDFVRGDDHVASDDDAGLNWFPNGMSKCYECNTHIFGPDDRDEGSVEALNRIMAWQSAGTGHMITYEADPRHAEITTSEMEVSNAKAFSSPVVKVEEDEEGQREFIGWQPAAFWSIVARANYLALGRPDIQYVCKGISASRGKPIHKDLNTL